MRVGVIGPKDLVQICVEAGKEHPEVQFVGLGYDSETEALELFQKNRVHIDVFLFTGKWVYYKVVEHYGTHDLGVPVFYMTPQSGSTIYQNLARMMAAQIDPRYISIDGSSPEEVREIYNEIGLDSTYVNVMPGDRSIPKDDLVNFHLNLWREGKTKGALTHLKSVYDTLKEMDVPVFRGTPSMAAIRGAVARAALEVQAQKAAASQIVVCLVCIDQLKKPPKSTYEAQRIKSQVYQELLEFSEQMSASVFAAENECFALFTTRGALAEATQNYSSLPLLQRVRDKLSATISVGFGTAPTARLSQLNAEAALHMCRQHGGNSAFLVCHDGSVIGPIGEGRNSECQRQCNDPRLAHIAAMAGLSVSTVTRLTQAVRRMGTDRFTANDLAKELGIASRNSRRILMRLVEVGAATIEGLQRPASKGRPRKVYAIRF